MRRHHFKVDGFALVFSEEPILVDKGSVVVLFKDMYDALAGRIAEDDRIGLEAAGDFGCGDFVLAGVKVEVDRGAGDGEVLVVDGERDWLDCGLLGDSERCGKEGEGNNEGDPHDSPPD